MSFRCEIRKGYHGTHLLSFCRIEPIVATGSPDQGHSRSAEPRISLPGLAGLAAINLRIGAARFFSNSPTTHDEEKPLTWFAVGIPPRLKAHRSEPVCEFVPDSDHRGKKSARDRAVSTGWGLDTLLAAGA